MGNDIKKQFVEEEASRLIDEDLAHVEDFDVELDSTRDNGVIREFSTGATRDTAVGKLDYEGFLNPLFLLQFAKYMNMHRVQSDGRLRDSDNWQKGIPKDICAKSIHRHFMDFWLVHRGYTSFAKDPCIIAAAMGIVFNIQAYLLEVFREKGIRDFDGDFPIPEVVERLKKLGFNSMEDFNASKS